jgi:hypothetical protein
VIRTHVTKKVRLTEIKAVRKGKLEVIKEKNTTAIKTQEKTKTPYSANITKAKLIEEYSVL